jgi:TolA-binding protein
MKLVFLALFFPALLLSAEPSVFGAGNLDSDTPYGLTDSEKYILKNKKRLENIKKETRAQDGKVESMRERMDGLQTIVEGLSAKTHQNSVSIGSLSGELEGDGNGSISARVEANTQAIVAIKETLKEFSVLLDEINNHYITKDDYNALIDEMNSLKKGLSKTFKSSGNVSASLSKMSNAQVAKKAQEFFKKKYYTNAITYYEHLIKKKYKPASAHYYIGEMNFRRKKYKTAISYFKESASRYDKASYMPTLLLHSAIAMEKTGDSANAQTFYSAVLAKYPTSKEAKEAEKRIK